MAKAKVFPFLWCAKDAETNTTGSNSTPAIVSVTSN